MIPSLTEIAEWSRKTVMAPSGFMRQPEKYTRIVSDPPKQVRAEIVRDLNRDLANKVPTAVDRAMSRFDAAISRSHLERQFRNADRIARIEANKIPAVDQATKALTDMRFKNVKLAVNGLRQVEARLASEMRQHVVLNDRVNRLQNELVNTSDTEKFWKARTETAQQQADAVIDGTTVYYDQKAKALVDRDANNRVMQHMDTRLQWARNALQQDRSYANKTDGPFMYGNKPSLRDRLANVVQKVSPRVSDAIRGVDHEQAQYASRISAQTEAFQLRQQFLMRRMESVPAGQVRERLGAQIKFERASFDAERLLESNGKLTPNHKMVKDILDRKSAAMSDMIRIDAQLSRNGQHIDSLGKLQNERHPEHEMVMKASEKLQRLDETKGKLSEIAEVKTVITRALDQAANSQTDKVAVIEAAARDLKAASAKVSSAVIDSVKQKMVNEVQRDIEHFLKTPVGDKLISRDMQAAKAAGAPISEEVAREVAKDRLIDLAQREPEVLKGKLDQLTERGYLESAGKVAEIQKEIKTARDLGDTGRVKSLNRDLSNAKASMERSAPRTVKPELAKAVQVTQERVSERVLEPGKATRLEPKEKKQDEPKEKEPDIKKQEPDIKVTKEVKQEEVKPKVPQPKVKKQRQQEASLSR